MYKKFEEVIEKILSPEQIRKQEMLSTHTTFRIGGPADYFLLPEKAEEVAEIIRVCRAEKLPYYVLGNGSNVLAADEGFRGVIIQVGKAMEQLEVREAENGGMYIKAGAGIMLSKFSKEAAKLSLTGLEFAAGIPGTLGGAVTMNAGAYGGEIKDCICWAKVVATDGKIITLDKEQLALGYRSSIIQKQEYIVVEAEFLLPKGEKDVILLTMEDYQNKRRDKQPLEFPSAGSTFKRPEGYFAGKLIEDAGLRGYRVGDIMVSSKHCGFVVNVGKGTAKDVQQLMKDVRELVYDKFQVELEPEVKFLP